MLRKFLITVILSSPIAAFGQLGSLTGFCVQGAVPAKTSGLPSTNNLQGIIPQCSVSVYLTGTTTLATIYSNNTSTPLTNPFQATVNGQWLFYSAIGQGYDVVLSGGFPPNVYTSPVTLTDLLAGGGGGGSVGPGIQPFATVFSNTGTVTNSNAITMSYAGNPLTTCNSFVTDTAFCNTFNESGQDSIITDLDKEAQTYNFNSLSGGVYGFQGTPPAWSSSVTYRYQQTVTYSGSIYIALSISGNLNHAPATSPTYWQIGGDTKSTRVGEQGFVYNYTNTQLFGAGVSSLCYANGECEGLYSQVETAGGNQSNGQEGSSGLRLQTQQLTRGWTATASTPSASGSIVTVPFTGTSNAGTLGEGSAILATNTAISGVGFLVGSPSGNLTLCSTYSSPTCNAANISTLRNYQTTTPTTLLDSNGIASGHILAQDATLCFYGVSGNGEWGSGLPDCRPVYQFTGTNTLQILNCFDVCSVSINSILAAYSTTIHWTLYASALPIQVSQANSTFNAAGAVTDGTIPIQSGDTLSEIVNPFQGFYGINLFQNNLIANASIAITGLNAQYLPSIVGTTEENSAPVGGSGVNVSGEYRNGLSLNLSWPTTPTTPRYGINYGNFPFSGAVTTPSTPPTTNVLYPLFGQWLSFINSGTSLNVGNANSTQISGMNVNLTSGSATFSSSMGGPYGSFGPYENLMLCADLQSSCISNWTATESPTINPNTGPTSPGGVALPPEQLIVTINTPSTTGQQQNFNVTVGHTYVGSVFMYGDAGNSSTLKALAGISTTSGGGTCANPPLVGSPPLPPASGWIQYTTLPCTWITSSGVAHFSFGVGETSGGVNPPIGSTFYAFLPCVIDITSNPYFCINQDSTSVSGVGAIGAYQLLAPIQTGLVSQSYVGVNSTGTIVAAAQPPILNTCGTTTTCANTNQTSPREVWGTVVLTGGAAVIGSMTAWTSTTSYLCNAWDITTKANAVGVTNTSITSITLAGTGTDTVGYDCRGN